MCECLRGFFRVTWTSSSSADSEREDSHGNPETTNSPVNNKQQSPPSNRQPFGPHLTPLRSISADEQDSPERILQKEKLHAELKRVLSERRSHLSETHSTLTSMDENSKMDSKNEQEKDSHLSELVEVVVETQAEVGASGYSVVGGGEQGIFIKEVLKDSPAAKHLSLQKGDQLLSARVYFDNVKYEDALKILQCAEPYKVSFFLKRAVPESDINIRPGAQNPELRSSKAKMQRMSVKSVKPFKTKKKKGGRFGLRRLKENKKAGARAQLDFEGLPGRSDLSPVDVEFALPNLKMRKDGKTSVDGSQQLKGVATSTRKKRKDRFPQMKAIDVVGGEGNVNVDISTHEAGAEISGAKLKAKAKGSKFGIHFPKIKKSKSDVQSLNGNFEGKELDAKLKPPSTELDFSMHQGNVEYNNLEIGVKGKAQDPEKKMPTMNIDVPDTKMAVPKIKLPKVRLSCHSDEIDGEKTDTPENKQRVLIVDIKPAQVNLDPLNIKDTTELKDAKMADPNINGTKISMTKLDTKQKFGDDLNGSKGHIIFLPKLDIAIPKTETSNVEISLPALDMSLPKVTSKNIDTEGHASTEIEFTMPKLDISVPKTTSPESESVVQELEKGEKLCMPSVDMSLQKGKPERNYALEGDAGKGGNFEISHMEITLPTIKLQNTTTNLEEPEIKTKNFNIPNISIPIPKGKAEEIESPSGKGVEIKVPHTNISLPKIKLPEIKIYTEGPKIKGGTKVDISLPKETLEGSADIEDHSRKGNKFNMPGVDVSLPNVKLPDSDITKGPDVKAEIEILFPEGKAMKNVEVTDPSVNGGNFKMPYVDVLLPKMKLFTGKINTEDPEIKGENSKSFDKSPLPAVKSSGVEISLPKCQMASTDITLPKGKEVGGPELDISLRKLNSPEGEMSLEAPDIKAGTLPKPFDTIPLPKSLNVGDINVYDQTKKRRKFQIPQIDLLFSRIKSREVVINAEEPEVKGSKASIPSIEVTLSKDKTEESFHVEGHSGKGTNFEIPKNDILFPKVKVSEGEIRTEGHQIKKEKLNIASVEMFLPKGKVEEDMSFKGQTEGASTFEVTLIDINCPKIKSSEVFQTPDVKGGRCHIPSGDISLPEGRPGGDVEGHAGKEKMVEMPKLVSLPKLKSHGDEIDVESPDIKGGTFRMSSIDISLPGGRAGGDVDVEGHAEKGGKFDMAKLDASLPKLKSPGAGNDIKGPDIKGGKFHMPSKDVSLPGERAGGDVDVKGHAGKGGKFEMPKFDVSLPKLKASGGDIDMEDPEIRGGQLHMPTIDIPLPGGRAEGDGDVEGHAGTGEQFEMPKLDVSLPKLKSPGNKIDTEVPDIKGEKFHMPSKFKSPGGEADVKDPYIKGEKLHMSSIDIALPGGKAGGDVDVQGYAGKGRKFEMPKLDVSLPKLKSPGVEIDIKGPDIKDGKFHMPSVDISLPGGRAQEGAEGALEGHAAKGREFQMSNVDVSLLKLKSLDGDIIAEDLRLKSTFKAEQSYDLKDDTEKCQRFHMSTVDISLPKLNLKEHELIEGRNKKGRIINIPNTNISMPTITHDSDVRATGTDISDLKDPEVTVGGNIKMPTVKITTVDISAPNVATDSTFPKGKGSDRENIELPKAEGGRPSSGISFHVPDISVKVSKKSLPTFLRKLKSGHKELESPGSIDLPSMETDGNNKTKIQMPSKIGKITDAEIDMSLEIQDNKGNDKMPAVEISLPTTNFPESEELLPKAEVDVSEADIKSYEGNLKIPKMPTMDISVPKVDLNVSLPKVKPDELVNSNSSDLNIDSRSIVNIEIPKVDISLPHGKSGDTDNLQVECKGGRNKLPQIPTVDISLPKGKTDENYHPEPEAGGGGRFIMTEVKTPNVDIKLPTVDISPPNKQSKDIVVPELQTGQEKCKAMTPDIKLTTIGISLPHDKMGIINPPELNLSEEGGKFNMPNTKPLKEDMSLSHEKTGDIWTPELEIEAKGGKLKRSGIKIPTMNVSLPHGQTSDLEASEPVAVGGQHKMTDIKIPKVDISIPQEISTDANVLIPATDSCVKITDSHKDSIKIPVKGSKELDLGLLKEERKNKKKTELSFIYPKPAEPKVNHKSSTFNFGMPKVKASGLESDMTKSGKESPKISKGRTDADLMVDLQGMESSLNMSNVKPPGLDFDIKINNSEEDKKQTAKVKIPKFGIPLPSLSSPEANLKTSHMKGHSVTVDAEVKKTVFVMANQQIKSTAVVDDEASVEIGDVKLRLPKIKMKPSFSKTKSNEKTKSINDEEGRPKTGKLKLPKVTFSSGKTRLFNVTLSGSNDGTSPNLNGDKDDKAKFGKLKFPKVEFFSPYSKETSEEEEIETGMKSRKTEGD